MDELSTSILVDLARREPSWATLGSHRSYRELRPPMPLIPLIPLRVIEENPAKNRRTRAGKPKTRSGCRTCKIRRVKCDEGKPHCLRCEKFGITCDGYGDPPGVSSRRKSKPTLLLPRITSGISLYTPPSTVKFENQEEYQYFLHFREQVTIDLSGSMPEDMWKQVIPRASNSESALRNLTVAVSAMDKARYSSSATYHTQVAAAKYGKALRGVQELISSRPDRVAARVSIIASMLIFCFENLQGEAEAATKHARIALNFMRKHLTPTVRYNSEQRAICSVPGLEDEMVDVIIRWDNITNQYMGEKPLLEIRFVDHHIKMPREFRNVHEVRKILKEWQYR